MVRRTPLGWHIELTKWILASNDLHHYATPIENWCVPHGILTAKDYSVGVQKFPLAAPCLRWIRNNGIENLGVSVCIQAVCSDERRSFVQRCARFVRWSTCYIIENYSCFTMSYIDDSDPIRQNRVFPAQHVHIDL